MGGTPAFSHVLTAACRKSYGRRASAEPACASGECAGAAARRVKRSCIGMRAALWWIVIEGLDLADGSEVVATKLGDRGPDRRLA